MAADDNLVGTMYLELYRYNMTVELTTEKQEASSRSRVRYVPVLATPS